MKNVKLVLFVQLDQFNINEVKTRTAKIRVAVLLSAELCLFIAHFNILGAEL